MTEVIRYYKFSSSNENVENVMSRALKKILCGKKDQKEDSNDAANEKARVNRDKFVVKPNEDNSSNNEDSQETSQKKDSSKEDVGDSKTAELKNSSFSILEQKCDKQYSGVFTKKFVRATLDFIAKGTIEEIGLFSEEVCSDPYTNIVETRIVTDASITLVTKSYAGGDESNSFQKIFLDYLRKNSSRVQASLDTFCTSRFEGTSYLACGGVLRGPVEDILNLEKILSTRAYGIRLDKCERVLL